jgi:hypothetical protein
LCAKQFAVGNTQEGVKRWAVWRRRGYSQGYFFGQVKKIHSGKLLSGYTLGPKTTRGTVEECPDISQACTKIWLCRIWRIAIANVIVDKMALGDYQSYVRFMIL